MNELVGFVNANNVRQKVLSLLSSKGEMEGERIDRKKERNVLPDRNRSKSRKNDPANLIFIRILVKSTLSHFPL